MNKDAFWIFGSLGLGDHLVMNALYRHYANLHKDRFVIIPCWIHNMAAIQWMLSDVPNIFFYPIETEQQIFECIRSLNSNEMLCLGFYNHHPFFGEIGRVEFKEVEEVGFKRFNPVLWDSEFYRQAGLDPELKWKGFKLPQFDRMRRDEIVGSNPLAVCHHDEERGFSFSKEHYPIHGHFMNKGQTLMQSVMCLYHADEIHCIDSSMLNLADLMETPYCKRFVFHRYARKGLPPRLAKNWEIID